MCYGSLNQCKRTHKILYSSFFLYVGLQDDWNEFDKQTSIVWPFRLSSKNASREKWNSRKNNQSELNWFVHFRTPVVFCRKHLFCWSVNNKLQYQPVCQTFSPSNYLITKNICLGIAISTKLSKLLFLSWWNFKIAV